MIWKINQPFDLKLTLRCGQGHRWLPDNENPGWYTSVIGSDLVRIRQLGGANGSIECEHPAGFQAAVGVVRDQFRLDDPISNIYRKLCDRDPKMKMLVECYSGLRVMRVDPWECLVFFILSPRSNISRIHDNMESLTKVDKIEEHDSFGRYQFPSAEELHKAGQAGLQRALAKNLGETYARRLIKTSWAKMHNNLDLHKLMDKSYQEAIAELCELGRSKKVEGIGPKVANCVSLFCLDKLEAFPVDSHIAQTLEKLYQNDGLPPLPRPGDWAGHQRIVDWSRGRFGPYAGYASQFLFIDSYESRHSNTEPLAS